MLDQNLFMWWDVNFLLIYLGLGWNDHAVYMGCVNEAQMGCVNEAQIGSRACCYITVHGSIHVVSCHHHFPRHCYVIDHVKLHIIIAIHIIAKSPAHVICHIINAWHGNWTCDQNYIIYGIYFRHKKWVPGLWGPGTFCDIFETSWIKQFMTKI